VDAFKYTYYFGLNFNDNVNGNKFIYFYLREASRGADVIEKFVLPRVCISLCLAAGEPKGKDC
jgi:hypothetical protein